MRTRLSTCRMTIPASMPISFRFHGPGKAKIAAQSSHVGSTASQTAANGDGEGRGGRGDGHVGNMRPLPEQIEDAVGEPRVGPQVAVERLVRSGQRQDDVEQDNQPAELGREKQHRGLAPPPIPPPRRGCAARGGRRFFLAALHFTPHSPRAKSGVPFRAICDRSRRSSQLDDIPCNNVVSHLQLRSSSFRAQPRANSFAARRNHRR